MALEKAVAARFDAIEEQIKVILDAVTTNAKTVDVLQAVFGELKKGRRGFSQPSLYVPSWLTGRFDAAA